MTGEELVKENVDSKSIHSLKSARFLVHLTKENVPDFETNEDKWYSSHSHEKNPWYHFET